MAIKIGFFGKNDRDNYVNFIEKRWIRVANEFALPHQEIFLHRDQKIAKNRFIQLSSTPILLWKEQTFLKGFLKKQNLLNVYKKPTLLLKQGFSTPFLKKQSTKNLCCLLKKIKPFCASNHCFLGFEKRFFYGSY